MMVGKNEIMFQVVNQISNLKYKGKPKKPDQCYNAMMS